MQRVARVDGPLPAKLVNSRGAQTRLLLIDDASYDHRHGHRRGMPTACGDPAALAGRIGRRRDAENLLRRAVELAPGWTAAKSNLALVLGRMGRPAEAMALLDEVFTEEPEEIGHWNLKAATLGRLGDFEQA